MEVVGAFDLRDEPIDCAAVRCTPDGAMRRVSDAVQCESSFGGSSSHGWRDSARR